MLADVGPGAFYGHTQEVLPPGFAWVLWPLAIVGRVVEATTGMSLESIAWALVKIPAMAADVLIAVLLYRVVGRWADRRAGLLAAALFLLIPVTWYESAIWGQIDSIGSLVLLAAIVALDLGWGEASYGGAIAATLVKPQFGIGLIVATLALARRHLRAHPWRLVTTLAAGTAVALVLVLPFDLEERAPDALRNVPVAGDVAGLVTIVGQQAGKDPVLAANAFTPWALVGPNPLPKSGIAHWSDDGLRLFGDVTAFTLGLWLAAAAFLIGGVVLLLRADRASTHLAVVTFLTVALFLLPTRVHERYVFPVFAVAAPLAAVSRPWRAWYVLVGLATTANLHAVLTYGGTLGVTTMPLGHEVQSPTAITLVALSQGALGVVAAVLVLADVGGGALGGRTLAGASGGNPRRWLLRLRAPTRSSAPTG